MALEMGSKGVIGEKRLGVLYWGVQAMEGAMSNEEKGLSSNSLTILKGSEGSESGFVTLVACGQLP